MKKRYLAFLFLITWTAQVSAAEMVVDDNGVTLKDGASVNEFSIDGTLAGNSDDAVPTEKAVKTYVDGLETVEKNHVIDGDFTYWPEGTNFFSASNGKYTSFNMEFINTSSTIVEDVARTVNVPNFAQSNHNSKYAMQVAVTTPDSTLASTDINSLRYHMTGWDLAQLHQKSVTLSFWVKFTDQGTPLAAKTFCVAFQNAAKDRSYVAEYTIGAGDNATWAKKSITLDLDTSGTWNFDNQLGMTIDWVFAAGSSFETTAGSWTGSEKYSTSNCGSNYVAKTDNNAIEISQVKLEVGDAATQWMPYDWNDRISGYAYYLNRMEASSSNVGFGEGHFNTSTTSNNFHLSWQFPMSMRAIPTVTYETAASTFWVQDAGSNRTVTGITMNSVTDDAVMMLISTSTAGTAGHGGGLIRQGNTAFLQADARH